ncbi:ubiquinol-cytochrome c reductase iron-sulfur subunit [Halonotius terrestris]|uniref:Ubiquinol-cytochrome c reductase iron-sulfur subunit n=1 Tax=Halonotius terrestris TaxID=2487750 RepID=A0A8J8TCP5_9EURY|nr:ubiquinol-cytochrome c reductase iron-sulfur subunit [Halonotius terrestris]TQQ81219.1 ubiquinol-cytochrome c reductase iron-sulfur subunit [Halonotius terrestris]
MSEDDKYPAESGRRRFVKGVVGGGALAGVGATGAVTVNTLTTASGAGGGTVEARVVENVGGPAPHGMPQIPIEIDDNGDIKGIWPEVITETVQGVEVEIARSEDFKGSGVTYSQEWFQYCGIESNNAVTPTYESDNYFKSDPDTKYAWQQDALSGGDVLNVSDLADYEDWGNGIGSDGIGKPAMVTWRSEESENPVPVTVLRSSTVEEAAQNDPWLEASTDQGVMAWLNKCTHFCCVPGYKSNGGDSVSYGAEDLIYCQCHQSVYDPFSVVSSIYVARPRPEG